MYYSKHLVTLIIFCSLVNLTFSQGFDYLPKSTTKQIVKHTYYTLSYSEENEQAEWVAYMITSIRAKGNLKRADKFVPDPLVQTQSAQPQDYKKSGYDRGHLAPAADMKFNVVAMKECFYMSNMSPQFPAFNRGIWKQLEEKVRDWALKFDTLYVITGGVLKNINNRIGANQVSVPGYYYKIILKYSAKEQKAIAFYFPNQKLNQPIFNYVVSIDKIEAITGIDFFPKLPDQIENKLESEINTNVWK